MVTFLFRVQPITVVGVVVVIGVEKCVYIIRARPWSLHPALDLSSSNLGASLNDADGLDTGAAPTKVTMVTVSTDVILALDRTMAKMVL